MTKKEVKEIFLNRGFIAHDLKETYFVLSDGTCINLGSRINCCNEIERTVEHNSIFSYFHLYGFEWTKFFKITGALQVIPETRTCTAYSKDKLTKKQLKFIEENNLEFML